VPNKKTFMMQILPVTITYAGWTNAKAAEGLAPFCKQ